MTENENNAEYFETIISIAPGHIYWKNRSGFFMGCNDEQARTFKLASAKEVFGKTDYDFYEKEQAEDIVKADRKIISSGEATILEEPVILLDGRRAIFISKKMPLRNKKGEIVGVIGMSFDITDRKIMEAELSSAKDNIENIRLMSINIADELKSPSHSVDELLAFGVRFLSSIIDLVPGHVYWRDKHDNYLGCNNEQALTLGFKTRDEIRDKKAYFDLPQAEAEKLLENDRLVLEQEQTITLEEVGLRANGDEGIFLTKKAPLYDSDKKVMGLLGVSIDITDKKKAEAELVLANERVESMRLVSASIAHELRTPLQSIRLFASGLESFLPDLIQSYELARQASLDLPFVDKDSLEIMKNGIASVYRQVDHASLVIDMLLTNLSFNKVDKHQFKVYSIADCVEEALGIYPFHPEEKALIHFSREGDFQFLGSNTLIIRVILNIIKNALYSIASVNRGRLKIGLEDNRLIIEDTARGISAEVLPYIFDKFYTKKTSHGTGIGLAFCKMCIAEHGGEILCESEEGCYARFIVNFPALDLANNKE